MTEKTPYLPTDDSARDLARSLTDSATFAALAVTDPTSGTPSVTRIAIATTPEGWPLTLISDMSSHTAALRADPNCALLLGEPTDKGDPLTHPRLTVHAKATFVARDSDTHKALRSHFLALRPKAKLYIDFGDFNFVQFAPSSAFLNGGFGKAFQLSAEDLVKTPGTTA